MMQTDVKAAHVEATGTMVSYRTRVKGYQFLGGGTAGDIILRDGGADDEAHRREAGDVDDRTGIAELQRGKL